MTAGIPPWPSRISRTARRPTGSAACAISACATAAHIREQLIALSDSEHVSTYCILDATVPLQRYVATLQLKPVTDGNRTFWHWQSTFDTPPGREAELADMVGRGVYEAGFEALRRHLRQGGDRPAAAGRGRRRSRRRDDRPGGGAEGLRRHRSALVREHRGAGAGAARGAHPPGRRRRQLHRRLYRQGRVPHGRAAGAARHGGGRHGDRCRGRGARHPARRPRGLCPWQAGRLCHLADPAGRSGRSGSVRHRCWRPPRRCSSRA